MTNNLTETLRDKFHPILLLTVYNSGVDKYEYYIESHDIVEGQVAAGKPLKVETIEEILASMYQENAEMKQFTGIMPQNLLHYKQYSGGKKYKMCWYQPEQWRKLFHAPALKIAEGFAMVPPMIYLVDRNYFGVYALDSNDRPDSKSKLYRAPFFNVDNNGSVCLGNAKVPKPSDRTYASLMKYWEDLFWLSKFTHVNGSAPVQGDIKIDELWRNMIKVGKSATWLPDEQRVSAFSNLILTDSKLEDII